MYRKALEVRWGRRAWGFRLWGSRGREAAEFTASPTCSVETVGDSLAGPVIEYLRYE